jgi:hypothetical protein
MAVIDDLPSGRVARTSLDENANYFIKDTNIPKSYVIVEASFQDKASYEPLDIGKPHPKKPTYFLYEESVTDIGGGLFRIESKYAIVPNTWYSFEAQNIPFTKFAGLSIVGSGSIVISTSYKFAWLNLQGIEDVRNFNENVYASTETKQGSINCVVRIKNEYMSVPQPLIESGALAPFAIDTAGYEQNDQNGTVGNIDDDMTFTFTTSAPSKPIKYEAGKYVGNIYYNKTYQIVSTFII